MTTVDVEDLPNSFKYGKAENENCFYVNLKNESDISDWIMDYSTLTFTNWRVKFSKPEASRYVCRKIYYCRHSAYRRVDPNLNKRGNSKNYDCKAKIDIVIKLTTKDTIKKHCHVRDGLPALVQIKNQHNHDVDSAAALTALQSSKATKAAFKKYFDCGLSIQEAINIHESNLELKYKESDAGVVNATWNPKYKTVQFWQNEWIKREKGPCIGEGLMQVKKYPAQLSGHEEELLHAVQLEKGEIENPSSSIQLKMHDAITKTLEDEEDCDKPLALFVGHPNDRTLKQQICEIVENADLQDISMNGVIQKIYNMYPKFNLKYRKEFIKSTLRSLLYRLGDTQDFKKDLSINENESKLSSKVAITNKQKNNSSSMQCQMRT